MATMEASAALKSRLETQLGTLFVSQALAGLPPDRSHMVVLELAFAASSMSLRGKSSAEIRDWLSEKAPLSPIDRMRSGRSDHADIWREQLHSMLRAS